MYMLTNLDSAATGSVCICITVWSSRCGAVVTLNWVPHEGYCPVIVLLPAGAEPHGFRPSSWWVLQGKCKVMMHVLCFDFTDDAEPMDSQSEEFHAHTLLLLCSGRY